MGVTQRISTVKRQVEIMDELISYESWDMALTAAGFKLSNVSPYGSRLYESATKKRRVCHFMPNPATRAWMKRNDVENILVLHNGEPVYDGDLPEFGLEYKDDYHSDYASVSKTMLSLFMESPVEYYYTYITGEMPAKQPTTEMKIGTICHAMLLERKTLEETCIAYPYSCYTKGAKPRLDSDKAREFEDRVAPLLAVREPVLEIIAAIINNAKKSAFGALLDLHGTRAKFEQRLDGVVEGVRCRCKPDILIPLSDQIIVPDLKFGAFKPEDWDRSQRRFKYFLQEAHYTRIIRATYGDDIPVYWTFWAFEREFPYRVGPKRYDPRSVEIAADNHTTLLRELKRCMDTNIWEDRYSTECHVGPWDMTRRGESESPEESTEQYVYDETEYQSDEGVQL